MINKATYVFEDVDGEKLRWEHVKKDAVIPVDVSSITVTTTEVPGDYELVVRLRSCVFKPTLEWDGVTR